MSTFAVTIETIATVAPHPYSTALDLLTIVRFPDFQFIVTHDLFAPGDIAIYFPADSVLSCQLQASLGTGELKDNRVRTCKIRGIISQGVLGKPEAVLSAERLAIGVKEGDDLTAELGVVKFISEGKSHSSH